VLLDNLNKSLKTNICIIGSGIGGGTLTQKLAEQNKEFVIIEAGEWNGDSENVSYENIGLDFGVRSTTTVQIGGTSNLWHGVLAPLDKIDFEKRDWIPKSGWAVSLEELEPYYKKASEVLKVEKYNYFKKDGLSDELNAQLDNLVCNREYIKNKLFQQSVPHVNFKDVVKKICEHSKKQHLYYNTTALELISENGKIIKLKVGNSDGTFSYVEAEQFIVCIGALETPRLLLNSNIKNKNIGKYLMDHPMGNLCQLEFLNPAKYPIYSDAKYSPNMKIKTGLELTDEKQKELKFPNHNFYLRPSFIKGIDNESEKVKLSLLAFKDGGVSAKDVWRVLTNLNVIRQIVAYKFSLDVTFKYADLFFVTEQIPYENSYVGLSDKEDKWSYKKALVNWQVSDEDIQSMKVWFELLLTELFPKEHYKFTHRLEDFNWKEIFTSAIHHVGTCRMGHDESEGVVDKNLKVFGVDNLYVCDGSIFTTAGNVNNGLTISAFACRLAEHLGSDR
jgi:choline dehydrogenase-like flavoprotein